ncbi:MAG: TetR/AcrR family transcriptional regulator [Nocardioidaceae bacterium]
MASTRARAGAPTAAPDVAPRRRATAERKREREGLILGATRELFDARGVRDALIDDIAKSVGINRAIIYRHFTGKEELFALTLVGYLDELAERLSAADCSGAPPTDRLRDITTAFVDFGVEYPAFVDCAQALMSKPTAELMDEVSEAAIMRLGTAMSRCLTHLVSALEAGQASGEFHVDDVDLMANTLYAQGLGGIALARIGTVIKQASPGVPAITPISVDQVRAYLVKAAVALATYA